MCHYQQYCRRANAGIFILRWNIRFFRMAGAKRCIDGSLGMKFGKEEPVNSSTPNFTPICTTIEF